jgi:hypothetical protein
MNLTDTVFVIPSRRKPPLRTLEFHRTELPTIIIADPRVYEDQKAWAAQFPNVSVELGKTGMIPQSAECYRVAFRHGYKFYFRTDDDLTENFFVGREKGQFFSVLEAAIAARECAEVLNVTLAGFCNTSIRIWLGSGFKRSYGLIHGGAHLCCAAEDPSWFIDERLRAYEDVYRSAAHRKHDGAVGRVNYIGLDKRKSLRDSSMSKTPDIQEEAKAIILGRFSDTVTCKGTRTMDDGMQTIPNWRLVAGPDWKR